VSLIAIVVRIAVVITGIMMTAVILVIVVVVIGLWLSVLGRIVIVAAIIMLVKEVTVFEIIKSEYLPVAAIQG